MAEVADSIEETGENPVGDSAPAQAEQPALFPGAPTVSDLHETDILASLSAWARGFGTDRETLRRCLLEREVQPVAERSGHKLYALRHVYRAWSEGADEDDPDKLSAFKRKAWYQGTREKIELQRVLGQLCDALDVEREIGQLTQTFVRGLETLQDRIERDAGLTPEQASALERTVDRLREELFEEIASRGEDEVDPAAAPPAPASPPTSEPPRGVTVSRETPSSGSAVSDGAAWLQRELADGPRPTAELIEAGKQAGLSEATLRRAKKELGKAVAAKRQGKGWVWQLAG